jgi:quinolinate synthase
MTSVASKAQKEFPPSDETVARELFARLKNIKGTNPLCSYTLDRCRKMAPLIGEINRLKREQNAVILAHAYLPAEILYGVADVVGDSFQLSVSAQKAKANTIIFAAVDFMAETAKILNPSKRVLKPNRVGGCSLAESVTAAQVRQLRERYSDYTFVCYINTTAEVKAECDVTVTSSNVNGIIDAIENDKIFFLPDRLMAQNILAHLRATGSQKKLQWSDGTCYVHQQYDARTIPMIRRQFPGVKVLAHPECHPTIAQMSDYTGSTSGMVNYVAASDSKKFFVMTECGLVGKMQAENPGKEFVGSCILCRYMKSNSLEDIYRVLVAPAASDEVIIDEDVRKRAERSLEKMFFYASAAQPAATRH